MESFISLIRSFGYPLIVLGIMAENFGLPVPGEILVFLASSGVAGNFSVGGTILAATMGAWMGDHLSYFMGRKAGSRFIDQYCRITLCSKSCSSSVERFYRKYGPITLVFARYAVGVRMLAVPVAGMSGIPYRRFAFFDFAGSFLWASLVTLAGRFLGMRILSWIAASRDLRLTMSIALLAVIMAVFSYKLWKLKKYGPARRSLRSR